MRTGDGMSPAASQRRQVRSDASHSSAALLAESSGVPSGVGGRVYWGYRSHERVLPNAAGRSVSEFRLRMAVVQFQTPEGPGVPVHYSCMPFPQRAVRFRSKMAGMSVDI